MDFCEDNATAAVVARFSQAQDARLREVMESFTRHLHAFVREIEPTHAEWTTAIDFLTATILGLHWGDLGAAQLSVP